MKARVMGLVMGLGLLAGTALAAPLKLVSVTLTGPRGQTATVRAEVADTDKTREYGLMNRDSLAADAGMIFIWPKPEKVSFWMKNTRIPLDMIFISNGYVVALAPNAKPMDETTISPPEPVDAVLEVNGGWAQAHGLTGPGWKVSTK